MVEITFQAKVLWITEDDLECAEDGVIEARSKFVWGPFTMEVEEIRFHWGQSKNRSVIECKSGRHILVAMPHSELREMISKAKEELYEKQLNLEDSDEEELILGEIEPKSEENEED